MLINIQALNGRYLSKKQIKRERSSAEKKKIIIIKCVDRLIESQNKAYQSG